MASAIHLFMVTALALTVLICQGVQGTGTCSITEIPECLIQSDAPTDRSPSNVLRYCSSGRHKFVSCIDRAISACRYLNKNKGGLMGAKEAVEYGCSSTRVQEYSVLSECVDSIQSKTALQRCTSEIGSFFATKSPCRALANYQSCIFQKMRTLCSEKAAEFMKGLMTDVLEKIAASIGKDVCSTATRHLGKRIYHNFVTIPVTLPATLSPALHGSGTCSMSATKECWVQSDFPMYRSPSNVLRYCSSGIYKYSSCLDTAIHSCPYSSSTIKDGLRGAKEGVEYGCATERVQEYSVLSMCVDSVPSVTAIKKCNSGMMHHILTWNICTSFDSYRSCVGKEMKRICSEEAAEFMQGLITHVLEKTLASHGTVLSEVCPGYLSTTPATHHSEKAYLHHNHANFTAGISAAPGPVGGRQSVMIFGLLLAFLVCYRRE